MLVNYFHYKLFHMKANVSWKYAFPSLHGFLDSILPHLLELCNTAEF